jgi:tetratricopeptide (TPR) repeat protein
MGRLGLARAGVERAFKATPADADLRAALRAVYEDTGALIELADLVVDESRAATDSNQQFEKLLEAARLLLYGTGESSAGPAMAERALVVLEEAKGLRPSDQDMLQLASESLAALGRGDEARSVLAELIGAHRGKRSRELGQVYYSLYRVESKNGNLSDALEALSKAHDNQPQNGGIALELGQLAVDLDEQDVAQRAFRSVTLLKTDGTSGVSPQERAVAYYHLGSIAFKAGDARRAKLMLEKSLAEDPSLDGARELLGQL